LIEETLSRFDTKYSRGTEAATGTALFIVRLLIAIRKRVLSRTQLHEAALLCFDFFYWTTMLFFIYLRKTNLLPDQANGHKSEHNKLVALVLLTLGLN
jgi:hypothetical protein